MATVGSGQPVPPAAAEESADDLNREDWKTLVGVLRGEGQDRYAELLAKDGRFTAHNGSRFTLYRCTATVDGVSQNVCVVVKIVRRGHIIARRVIVGLDRKLAMFVDEPRIEAPDSPKEIAYGQATNTDLADMKPMASSAVLLLAWELVAAARNGDLADPS
jgi:hypothetical protein